MNQPQYNQVQPMPQNQNSNLVDGLFIDTIQTRFGYIDKLGIHRERLINWLMQQQVNDKGYLNVDLLTAQNTGKKYAKLNTYQSQQQVKTPPPYTGNMGQPQQYQQPRAAQMPNGLVYNEQPGPAVQQGQPYNDSNVQF